MSNVIEFSLEAKDNASKTLARMATVAKSVAKSVAAIATAVLAYATVLVGFAKRIANVQDEAGKFALKIGKSVENVSKMQFVAKLAGIQVNTFNMAVQRMERRLGEAAQGTGEALAALRELGIEAKSFAELPLDVQLDTLADKFANMTSGSDALRTAFKLFDSEGVVMLQMLKGGSEAMQAMAREAERLGLVISAQAAANSQKFNDTITKLTGSMDGATRMMTNQFIPMLTGVADGLAELVVDNKEDIVAFFTSMTVGAIAFGIMAKGAFDTVSEIVDGLFDGRTFEKFNAGAAASFDWIVASTESLRVAVTETLVAGFALIWDAFVSVAATAMAMVIVFGARWVTGFAKIVVGTFELIWDGFISMGKGAFTTLKNIFGGGPKVSLMDAIFGNIEADTAAARDKVSAGLSDIGGRTAVTGTTLIDGIIGDTGAASTRFLDSLTTLSNAAQDTGQTVSDSVGGMLDDALVGAGTKAKELMESLNLLGTVAENMATETSASVLAIFDEMGGRFREFMKANGTLVEQLGLEIHNTMLSALTSVSDSIANSIVANENLLEGLKNVANQVLASVISMLIQVAVQRLISAAIGATAAAKQGGAEMAVQAATTYATVFKSTASIGPAGVVAAPAVAAASTAVMLSGAAGAGVAGKVLGGSIGAAHGGLDYVPSEQTILVDRGERIVSPNQNKDLTNFLAGGGGRESGGGGVTIGNITILPNATNAQAFLDMPDFEIRRIVEEKIIKALDDLDQVGVRQRNVGAAI